MAVIQQHVLARCRTELSVGVVALPDLPSSPSAMRSGGWIAPTRLDSSRARNYPQRLLVYSSEGDEHVLADPAIEGAFAPFAPQEFLATLRATYGFEEERLQPATPAALLALTLQHLIQAEHRSEHAGGGGERAANAMQHRWADLLDELDGADGSSDGTAARTTSAVLQRYGGRSDFYPTYTMKKDAEWNPACT